MGKKLFILFLLIFSVIGCGKKEDPSQNGDNKKPPTNNQKTIGDLEIGSLVVDNSWEWEIRASEGYSGTGIKKPIVWIVVAKNHYEVEGDVPHVTLLSKEILGRYTFDNSTDRGSVYGINHWGDSGTTNATRGIRTFLTNVFLPEFSNSFNSAVLTTNLPSAHAITNEIYYTQDKVFIPCRSEIDRDLRHFTPAGSIFEYFDIDDVWERFARRKAQLPGLSASDPNYANFDDYWNYFTRTPSSGELSFVYRVVLDGNYSVGNSGDTSGFWGIRPIVNISSSTVVSEEADEDGVYNIKY